MTFCKFFLYTPAVNCWIIQTEYLYRTSLYNDDPFALQNGTLQQITTCLPFDGLPFKTTLISSFARPPTVIKKSTVKAIVYEVCFHSIFNDVLVSTNFNISSYYTLQLKASAVLLVVL